MNNRVFWGAICLAVAAILGVSAYSDAARRLPQRDGVLIAGHDGVDQQILKVDDTGTAAMGGSVASGATDSGNPVKVGGVYNSTLPTLTNGQRGDLQVGTRGSIHAEIWATDSANPIGSATSAGDDVNGGARMLNTQGYPLLFDAAGANFDRQRQVENATNSTGQGIAAAGLVAQYDDTSPTTITENQFGNLRMSATRGLLTSRQVNGGTLENSFSCDQSAVINVSAAATTQLVALASSQIIRVCSFVISGDTLATTATFVYGTGSNCATGQAALTGAMRMPDEGSIAISGMNGSLFRTIASNALCLTAAAGAVTGFVTYAQY